MSSGFPETTNSSNVSQSDSAQRWRFVRDEGCHNYLIPAVLYDKFDVLLETGELGNFEKFDGLFSAYRIDGIELYTFENPIRDK
jgi:hypothetical protein